MTTKAPITAVHYQMQVRFHLSENAPALIDTSKMTFMDVLKLAQTEEWEKEPIIHFLLQNVYKSLLGPISYFDDGYVTRQNSLSKSIQLIREVMSGKLEYLFASGESDTNTPIRLKYSFQDGYLNVVRGIQKITCSNFKVDAEAAHLARISGTNHLGFRTTTLNDDSPHRNLIYDSESPFVSEPFRKISNLQRLQDLYGE